METRQSLRALHPSLATEETMGQKSTPKRRWPLVGMATLALSLPFPEVSEGVTFELPEVLVSQSRFNSWDSTNGRLSLTKYQRPLLTTPQTVSRVSAETMREQQVTTLRDAVRNVAGISLSAGEGGAGQGDAMTVRGFSARTDLYLDGMRDTGNYQRDAFYFESVEVLKGPSSTTFGRGSTGGIINQVSKKAGGLERGQVSVGLSSSHRERVTLDYNLPLRGTTDAVRVNAFQDAGSVAGRQVVNTNRSGIAPTITWGAGTHSEVSLSYLGLVAHDVPDFGVPWVFESAAPVPRDTYYGFTDDFLNTKTDIVTATWKQRWDDNLRMHQQIRFGSYRRQLRATKGSVTATRGTPLQDMVVNRTMVNRDSTETVIDHQLDVLASFKTGEVGHDVAVGTEWVKETSTPITYTITAPSTTLLNPVPGAFNGTVANPVATVVQSDTVSMYAMDTLAWAEQWDLTAGLRWDHIRSHFASGATHGSSVDSVLSARGALTFQPLENGSVYASFGQSFNPSAENLSLTQASVPLSPEQNQSYEIGSKWSWWQGRVSLRMALFRTDKLNAREQNPANANQMVLAGHQRVEGIEIEGQAAVTDAFRLSWGYAHMKSQLMSSAYFPAAVGGPIQNVPAHSLTVWGTYRLPWKIDVGAGFNYVDARRGSTTAPSHPVTGQPYEVPAYCVFNAMVSTAWSEKVSTQLNIYNLFDLVYIDQVYPSHVVPGEGRTMTLTMTVRL